MKQELEQKPKRCNSWTCPICRYGECVGDKELAKEFGWCDQEKEVANENNRNGI